MQPPISFSIITPTFNQAAFIESTILSVVEQDYPNFEYIVIDGGSEDGTQEIIRKYENRIANWISEKDEGQTAAINKGIRLATGNVISWLGSDDLYLPGTLRKVAAHFQEHPEIGLLHGKSELFGVNQPVKVIGADAALLPNRYFATMAFPQPSSFFSREALDKCGLPDETLHYGMDFDLFLRFALRFPVLQVDDILSRYRLQPESKTVTKPMGFASDWKIVFSRFVHSVSFPDDLSELLIKHNMLIDADRRYPVNRTFTREHFVDIVCQYLVSQLNIRYESLDKQGTVELLELIRNIDARYYKRAGLNRIKLRSSFLPSPAIRLLRKLLR